MAHHKTAIFLKYISKDDGTFFYHLNQTRTTNTIRANTDIYSSTILQPILYVNIQTTQNTFESYQIILTPDSYKNPTKFEIKWDPQNAYIDNPDVATASDIIRKYNPLATATEGITLANEDAVAVAAVAAGVVAAAHGVAAVAAQAEAIRVGVLTRALDVEVLTVPQNQAQIDTAITALATAKTALQTYADSAAPQCKYIAAIISSNLNIVADDTLDAAGANVQADAADAAAASGARSIYNWNTANTNNTEGSASGLQIRSNIGAVTAAQPAVGALLVSIDQLPHHTAYTLRPTLADIVRLKYRLKALGNIFGNTKTISNVAPIQGGGNKSRRRKRYTQKNIIE